MDIKDQVCSLELSKQLKEFVVKQESYFYYEYYSDSAYMIVDNQHTFPYTGVNYYSGFTAEELMELIPETIDTKKNEPFNLFNFVLQKKTSRNIRYLANYHCDTVQFDSGSPFFALKLINHSIYDEKLSNCLAKVLIYLYENDLIKPSM